MMKPRTVAVVATLALLVLSSCRHDDSMRSSISAAEPSVPPDGSPYTASAAWMAQGEVIREGKIEQSRTGPYESVANADPYAFLSEPVDVTRDGSYTLRFPVDGSFTYPDDPSVYAYNLPPDAAFQLAPGVGRTVAHGGVRYLLLDVEITGVTTPYTGFQIWLY